MRIRHLIKSFVPVVVLLLTGTPASAQYGSPYPSSGMTYYNGSPGMGGAPGSPMMQGQMMPPQGGPPSFLPYPNVSPYDHMLDETYNQDGLWFRNTVDGFGPFNHPRSYYFNVDYTNARTRKLRGIVGDEDVESHRQAVQSATATGGTGGTATGGTAGTTGIGRFFDPASASMIPDLKNDGIRLSGGFWNTDGSGVMFSTTWNAAETATYDARANIEAERIPLADVLRLRASGGVDGAPAFNLGGLTDRRLLEERILAGGPANFDSTNVNQYSFFGRTNDILSRSLFILHGLPLANGYLSPTNPNGTTVLYDMDFIIQHTASTFGATTDWAFNPIYERSGVKLRPVFGGRYQRIDERFSFRGVDSGLGYVFTPADGIDNNGDFIVDDLTEGGVSTFTATTQILRASLDSKVRSDLAGPELGMHYEVGRSKGLRFTGATKLAAMFNRETLSISGNNIGDHFSPDLVLSNDNRFSDQTSNTHISPLLEQSLNAEIPLFSRVPVLRDMWQLEKANLSLGWTYLLVGKVADPNQSIVWASRPEAGIFPQARVQRDTFYQNTFNVGINWNY
jgi:hypothetical protein